MPLRPLRYALAALAAAPTSPSKLSCLLLRITPRPFISLFSCGTHQDFTCMTFIDDSPRLQTWGTKNKVVDSLEESDRSSGRVVLGTTAGDLYVFIQRGIRLIPREARRVVSFLLFHALATGVPS